MVREIFALDYRSLSLMRMGVGAVLLWDALWRLTDFYAHYSDMGVLPRADVLQYFDSQWIFSLYFLSGNEWFAFFLLLVSALFALSMMLGYRTRFMTMLSFIMLLSVQTRNPLVLQGGDIALRVILFFMLFLPLDRRWSLDAFFHKVARPQTSGETSVAGVAYLIQFSFIYIFSAFFKTDPVWHAEGTAVYRALQLDQFVRPLGAIFRRQSEALLRALTRVAWYGELYGPFFLISPFFSQYCRLGAVVFFLFLQIGFNSMMRLGLFGPIMIAISLGLLPELFWILVTPIGARGKKWLMSFSFFEKGKLWLTERGWWQRFSRFERERVPAVSLSRFFGIREENGKMIQRGVILFFFFISSFGILTSLAIRRSATMSIRLCSFFGLISDLTCFHRSLYRRMVFG